MSEAIVELYNFTDPEVTTLVFSLAPTHCFFSDVKKSASGVMIYPVAT